MPFNNNEDPKDGTDGTEAIESHPCKGCNIGTITFNHSISCWECDFCHFTYNPYPTDGG